MFYTLRSGRLAVVTVCHCDPSEMLVSRSDI